MPLRITLAVLVSLTARGALAASGFYNLPTTLPQWFGGGYGPGYHADLALKPSHQAWNEGRRVVRRSARDDSPTYFGPVEHAEPAATEWFSPPGSPTYDAPFGAYLQQPAAAIAQPAAAIAQPAARAAGSFAPPPLGAALPRGARAPSR